MPQTLQINIKSAIFDRPRLLTVHPSYLVFDDKESVSPSPVKFFSSDIVACRHGIEWVSGFITARTYCIDICNAANDIIQIRLKSIYGIRENEMAEKYSAILNGLYDNYFDAISRAYLRQFESGDEFSIMDTWFSKDGIFLNETAGLLAWNDIEVKIYPAYYAICSISNGRNYKIIEPLTAWNGGVLYSVLLQILKYTRLQQSKGIV